MAWESLDALPVQLPLPFHGLLPPDPFEPGDQADAGDHRIHSRQPGEQGLLLADLEVEAGAHAQAENGVDDGDHGRPGETEPQGGEDDGEQGHGGKVGHVGQVMELAADDDGGRDQYDIRAAEEEEPAPSDRPLCLEPVVDQAVAGQQRQQQEQEGPVAVEPEAGPVGQFNHGGQPDEPAPPDGDPRRVGDNVGVGPYGARHLVQYLVQYPLQHPTWHGAVASPEDSP